MSDWIDSAEGGWDADMAEKAYVACPTGNMRFWMPSGSSRKVVFLTEEPSIALWEHQIKIGKSFRNWATCLAHQKVKCPLCELSGPGQPVSKYKAMPFTVIDRSEYKITKGPRAGEIIKDSIRLFLAKGKVAEKLARKAERLKADGKSLRFAEFEVFRSKDDKSPNVGDDFEFIRMVDPASLPTRDELDYKKLLEPNLELVAKYLNALKSRGTVEEEDTERSAF